MFDIIGDVQYDRGTLCVVASHILTMNCTNITNNKQLSPRVSSISTEPKHFLKLLRSQYVSHNPAVRGL